MQTGNQTGRQTGEGLADRITKCQVDKLRDSQKSNSLEKRTKGQNNRLAGRQGRRQVDSSS